MRIDVIFCWRLVTYAVYDYAERFEFKIIGRLNKITKLEFKTICRLNEMTKIDPETNKQLNSHKH